MVKLFWLAWQNNIVWSVVWVPRELNAWADRLSKHVDPDDWKLNKWVWDWICEYFGPFDCDRFASESTALLPCFCASFWSPSVWFVDCFSRPWCGVRNWWHPNPKQIGAVLAKACSELAPGALFVPVWPSAWWWPRLCPDGKHLANWVSSWLEVPSGGRLFVRGKGNALWNRRFPHPSEKFLVVGLNGFGQSPSVPFCLAGGCSVCRPVVVGRKRSREQLCLD